MINILVACYMYNVEPEQFHKSLDSLMNQDIRDFVVYIFEDNSTLYKEENIQYIKDKYPSDRRIKVIYNVSHCGEAECYNYILNTVDSNYIAIHSFDTILDPNKLDFQYTNLEGTEDLDCITNQLKDLNSGFTLPNNWENTHLISMWDYNSFLFESCFFTRELFNRIKFIFSKKFEDIFKYILPYLMISRGKVMFSNNKLGTISYNKEDTPSPETIYKIRNILANDQNTGDFTCILFPDDTWGNNFEKTILNIRLKSNSTRIVVVDSSVANQNDYSNISTIYGATYVSSNNNLIYNIHYAIESMVQTNNFMVITKPCMFGKDNFDIYFNRYLQRKSEQIITPYTDNVIGYTFRLFDLDIKKEMKYFYTNFNSDMVEIDKVPIINNTIFATSKSFFNKIQGLVGLQSTYNINTYISLKAWLSDGECNIAKNIDCETLMGDQDPTNDVYKYYYDLWFIYKMFLNETLFIHEDLIQDKIKTDFDLIKASYDQNKDNNNMIHEFIFKMPKTLSWFMKNINSFYYYV